LEAAYNEVTPEDLWKGIKTVLLEVAREMIGSVKSQKKKKCIFADTCAVIREKREANKHNLFAAVEMINCLCLFLEISLSGTQKLVSR